MRTIKFRGIRLLSSDWEYGNLIQRPDGGHFVETGDLRLCPVQDFSVGQFTGLLDKNGKEIFEGDIVAVYDGDDNKKGQGKVEFLEDWGVWYIGTTIDDGLFDVNYNSYIEVIGNIHDDPELLKNND